MLKPQWYSETGSKWLKIQEGDRIPGPCVNMGEGDRPSCKYQVRCCVLFDDGTSSITPWVDWGVYVYKSSPLTARPNFFKNDIGTFAIPNVEADDDKQANGKYIARVRNRGDFKRIPAQISTYGGMTNSNGFWNKIIVAHEGEHVNQWSTQDPWNGLYGADALWLT